MKNAFRLTPVAAALLTAFALPTASAADAEPSSAAPAAGTAQQMPAVKVESNVESEGYKPDAVSSPKFTQPLVDTPQTITVIRKEVMADQGAVSLTEALRNTPGITFQAGENGNTQSGDTIFMRGFDAQGSVFIDNIRDLSPAVRDVFNVEQVEVAKGPAGADNGRGNAGGYVNLVSKTPFAENDYGGSLSYGSEDRRRISADLNQVLAPHTAARLNVVGIDGGVAGRPQLERRQWGLAPSLTFGLGTPTRLTLFSQHIRQDNTPDGGVSAIGVDGYRNPILEGGNSTNTIVDPKKVDDKNFYGLRSDFEDIKSNTVSVRVEHDLDPTTTIRNTSRYSKIQQQRVLTAPLQAPVVSDLPQGAPSPILRTDPDTWTVARSRHASYRDNELLTNQTNVTADLKTGTIEHDLSGGFEFIYESQDTPTYAVVGTQTAANLYNPNPSDPAAEMHRTGAFTDGRTTTAGVYLFDTLKFSPQWQALAGVRWDHYDTVTDSATISTATSNPTLPVGTSVGARVKDADSLYSWKTALTFKPSEASSLYAAVANSKRPPGGDNFALAAATTGTGTPNANVNVPSLKPQSSRNYEVGTKWELFDKNVIATAALFKATNKNDLARTTEDTVTQYGKRQVKGLELGLVGSITKDWNVSAGYTYQKAKVKDGAVTVVNGQEIRAQDGNLIQFSPKNFANLWTTYKLSPIPLTLGGGVRYVDSQARTVSLSTVNSTTGAVTPANSGILKVDDYMVLDLVAIYDITKVWSVQLNGYNVTDKNYVGSVNNSGQRYFPGVPASYLLTINMKL